MTNKEIRTVIDEHADVRISGGLKDKSRTISGYGIVFNSESRDLGGFTEIILPEAVDGVIEKSDILALMNHDISRGVLARSTNGIGSMKLTVDSKGVKYAFEAPTFDLGDQLVEGITRGDIKSSSFAFTIAKGGEKLERRRDGSVLRIITRFDELFDMSPCYREAYEDTTVALRSLEEFTTITEPIINKEDTKPIVCDEPAIEPIVEPEVKKWDRSVEDLVSSSMNYRYKRKI